jgi:DNA replication and repair protein RecF
MQRQSELAIALLPRGRRLVVNGKETKDSQKFATYFAAVAFHPGTLNVIKGGPAGRRLLIDRGIASLQPAFVQVSQDSQRLLKQRNALLRGSTDSSATLEVWTERFIEVALHVTQARQEHITILNPYPGRVESEAGRRCRLPHFNLSSGGAGSLYAAGKCRAAHV